MENIEKIEGCKNADLDKILECLEKIEKGELTVEECCKELDITKSMLNRALKRKQLYFHKKTEKPN